jgi:hypothetical protein
MYSKSNHPHHVKREVVYSLVNRGNVIYQDQKGFNNEIKNVNDLMLNVYPKEFRDSGMKPSTRNRLSSDKTYQGTLVILYV